jgi:hypothetical protein
LFSDCSNHGGAFFTFPGFRSQVLRQHFTWYITLGTPLAPFNNEAMRVLKQWREPPAGNLQVVEVSTGFTTVQRDCRKGEENGIPPARSMRRPSRGRWIAAASQSGANLHLALYSPSAEVNESGQRFGVLLRIASPNFVTGCLLHDVTEAMGR